MTNETLYESVEKAIILLERAERERDELRDELEAMRCLRDRYLERYGKYKARAERYEKVLREIAAPGRVYEISAEGIRKLVEDAVSALEEGEG